MSPWSWFLLPTLCLLPAIAAPPRGAPASANCKLKAQQNELNSFLWTIKRDPPSYFFGMIHVPYTWVWDFIPDNSKEAFQQSSIVYFELDLTDPYTISALTSCQMLPRGENLQDVLPRDIYCHLKRHLEYVKPSWMTPDQHGKGLYADCLFNAIAGNWERKRPVWVMLMVNSLTEVDIKSCGVPVLDLYLAQEAKWLRKQTGAVEKVEEQCHPLSGLNFSQVPNFINATLPPEERITVQEIDSYFRRELIYKRNERTGKRVKALLEEFPDKGFFFAFGAEKRPETRCHSPSPLPAWLRKRPPRKLRYRKLGLPGPHCCRSMCLCPEVPTCRATHDESSARSRGGRSGGSGSGSSATCGSDWRRGEVAGPGWASREPIARSVLTPEVLWAAPQECGHTASGAEVQGCGRGWPCRDWALYTRAELKGPVLGSHSSRSPFWTGAFPPSCGSLALGSLPTARWWSAVPACLSGHLCYGCWCWCWLSKQRQPSCNDQRSQAKT
ncbi:metalloprotease TIKI1 isoform X5 [Mesoplodon densirostris]|uniref:metalloprotease TIKI1 isoform X5 n=1 Tax=Mesoplodon densirostris TaxID=48708 RepID=UPI0028DB04B3|nr:metalloprotease TIKI1 isoform X5 [Mesoplodon densirostris]